MKQALWVEQVQQKSMEVHNATYVVSYLTCYFGLQHLTHDGARRDIQHYFYEVKPTDVNRVDQFNAQTKEATQCFHQIKSVGLDKIPFRVRALFCFCRFCFNGGNGPCDNEAYIAPFNLVQLEPCNANDAHVDVEFVPQLEINWEALVATIEAGDHFVVVAKKENSEGSDFGLLFVRNHCQLWRRK